MEGGGSNLPEKIHSLLGLKSNLTSDWAQSVCNIVKNEFSLSSDISSPSKEEEDESVFTQELSIRDQLSELMVHVNDQNKRRRHILNELLDLKGNIRVFCRVKPVETRQGFENLILPVTSDARNVTINLTESKSKTYSFDGIFQPDSSQDDVFLEIEPVIKSVIDGYNACIFAYGQTGTGKTFTMEGSLPDSPGIVPRTIKGLFKQVEESNNKFAIKFSMVEIYMGNLRDLLVSQETKSNDPLPPSLLIHTDAMGEIYIENLATFQVKNFDEVFKLYEVGRRNRATAFTNSNSTSSRSHCMIRVSITCSGAPERPRETNKIWLVDLGGSERVVKTKATGRRFDEGKAINLSLSALGEVINSLQQKSSHIPYRNSKLTQVLKDSLGKDSKTLMLVHISPKEEDICETICSLNFATRAKNIHLGPDESTEEQEQKEIAMKNLERMIEKIEQERELSLREIRNLNATLEKLSGKPQVIEEETEEVTREAIIQATPKTSKLKQRRASDVFPSFMRPTASSRRLSRNYSAISDVSSLKSRRNSIGTVRSKSMSLSTRKKGFDSECDSSDKSVSKSTCVRRLNVGDDATVTSQDMSENVVSEHQPRILQMGPRTTIKAHSKIGNFKENVNENVRRTEFSRINTWLHSQSESKGYVADKKQLPVTPSSSRSRSSDKSFTMEMITDNEIFEEESKTEDAEINPTLLRKKPYESEDQVMSNDDDKSLYPPSSGYDGFSQHIDNKWFGVEDSTADWERGSSALASILECESEIIEVVPDIDMDGSLKQGSQNGLTSEDVAAPFLFLGEQEIKGQRGKVYTLVQKLQAVWFRILLGLGLIDVGYSDDFFNGLTK